MDYQERMKVVNNLLSDRHYVTISGKVYYFIHPTSNLIYLADIEAEKIRQRSKFDGCLLSSIQCLPLLFQRGICTPDIDILLESVDKQISDAKVELYENFLLSSNLIKQRQLLGHLNKYRFTLSAKKHALDLFTLDNYIDEFRMQYLLLAALYYEDGKPVISDMSNMQCDNGFVSKVILAKNKTMLSTATIREVARTEPWKSNWSAKGKQHLFPNERLSNEQLALIMYSSMYDNIDKHPECPPNAVIEDDDICDGWIEYQRRQRNKTKMENELSKVTAKHNNAEEVFIMASNKKEAQQINRFNDTQAQIVKKQREAVIQNRGVAVDLDFSDKRLQLHNQAQQGLIQNTRRK